ncbi:hypothetical protein L1887_62826 [Cichorium endivia]|nr:hypothetical protein L1887_62826 [Cichorium endivia]
MSLSLGVWSESLHARSCSFELGDEGWKRRLDRLAWPAQHTSVTSSDFSFTTSSPHPKETKGKSGLDKGNKCGPVPAFRFPKLEAERGGKGAHKVAVAYAVSDGARAPANTSLLSVLDAVVSAFGALASEGEAALLLGGRVDGPAALDAGLLLLELLALAVELLLHLAVAGVELLLALLQLALLLRHLLLEDHLHLELHLGQLLLVQRALLLLLDGRVDLLEDAGVLRDAHGGELVGAVVLVQEVVGVLLELLHVRADEHLAQLDEVAVLLVVDLDDAPGVAAAADLATFGGGDLGVGADDSEGNLGHDLGVLGNGLLVVELVAGALENLDVVVLNVAEDLLCC